MAEKSMFFRSFGDRRYYSTDWAKYFSTLIKGGVLGAANSLSDRRRQQHEQHSQVWKGFYRRLFL